MKTADLRALIAAIGRPLPFLLTDDCSAMFDAAGKELDDLDAFPTVRAMVAALNALPAHLDQLDRDAERIRALEDALLECIVGWDRSEAADMCRKIGVKAPEIERARALLEAK